MGLFKKGKLKGLFSKALNNKFMQGVVGAIPVVGDSLQKVMEVGGSLFKGKDKQPVSQQAQVQQVQVTNEQSNYQGGFMEKLKAWFQNNKKLAIGLIIGIVAIVGFIIWKKKKGGSTRRR